jgi:hypothetical protein
MKRFKGACTDWTSYAENNQPNCLITKVLTKNAPTPSNYVRVHETDFAATFDVNKYRGSIQSQLEKRLGRPLLVGDMSPNFLPPRFRVQNLAVRDDPRFSPDAPFHKSARAGFYGLTQKPLLAYLDEIHALSPWCKIVDMVPPNLPEPT